MSNKKVIDYINKFVSLTPEKEQQFLAAFKEVKIKKRQFIMQPNFTAKHRNNVLEGAFRSYIVCDNGIDYTITFAIDDWWITDYNSYVYQEPATMFVVALEDSIVLQLDYDKEQEIKKMNWKFETFFRIIAERSVAFYQRRLINNLIQNAEAKYKEFEDKYPLIVQRVLQYALASY
jgi:signal-transduction protein with cAMP-binding, CBS, and nucleotidyltransferase domain